MNNLNNIVKNSTFGVELELCVCLYELFSTFFKVHALTNSKKTIPKKLKNKWEKILDRLITPLDEAFGGGYKRTFSQMINKGNIKGDLGFGRGDLEAMYGLMVLNDKNCDEKVDGWDKSDDYSRWTITKDQSILCGIKELNEGLRKMKKSSVYYEEFKDDFKKDIGIIVPNNNTDYIKKFKDICEKNMFSLEIISKKYLYNDLDKFLNTLDNCIFHEDVVYEVNTSQGLHISIGNELIKNLDDEKIIKWLSNLINLWYKFEKQIFDLIPVFRHNNRFAKPINSIFKNITELNKINKINKYNKKSNKYKYPEWLNFYARNIELWGGMEDNERAKYTSINIKGLSFDKSSTDPNKVSIDKNTFVEFRLLPASTDTDLISNWVSFLTYFAVISLHKKSWVNAMESNNLSNIFPSSLKDGKNILKYLENNVNSNVLYKLN